MRFKATPYAQNELAFRHPELVHFPSPTNFRVGEIAEYDIRQALDLEAPSPQDALEQCWELYQNIDSTWLTPDGLRSLMTSDLVLLVAEDGAETFWICCSSGWHEAAPPQGYEANLALPL